MQQSREPRGLPPARGEVWAPPSSPRSLLRWGRGTKATGGAPAQSPQQAQGCPAGTRSALPVPSSRPGAAAHVRPHLTATPAGKRPKEGRREPRPCAVWGRAPPPPTARPAPPPHLGTRAPFSAVNGFAPLLCSETPQGGPDHARPRFAASRGSGARPPGPPGRRPVALSVFPRTPTPVCARPQPRGPGARARPQSPRAPEALRRLPGRWPRIANSASLSACSLEPANEGTNQSFETPNGLSTAARRGVL